MKETGPKKSPYYKIPFIFNSRGKKTDLKQWQIICCLGRGCGVARAQDYKGVRESYGWTGKLWVDVTAMIPTAMTISQTYTHVKTYKLTLFKYMWLIICQVSSTKLFKICVDLNCLDKTSKNLHCAKEKLRSDSNYSKNRRSTK